MGLFNRKKEQSNQETAKTTTSENTSPQSFVMGVMDVFPLKDSDDIVVVGKVKGKVTTGAAVYVSNMGEDDDQIFLTTILGVETGPNKPVEEATDTHVGLKIEKGKSLRQRTSPLHYKGTLQKNIVAIKL